MLVAAWPVCRRDIDETELVDIELRLLRYLAAVTEPCAGVCRDAQTRAMSVPERAANCGHQRSLTGTANVLRSGHGQVGPLRETTF